MHTICRLGPFSIDSNVSNMFFIFDGTIWCILRKCISDATSSEYGMVQLEDVRSYRSRERTFGEVPDTELEVPKNCWFIEQENSIFLDHARASDPQRSANDLSAHRHFVLFDGSSRVLDVVARAATLRQRNGPLRVDISALIEVDDFDL